jgi:pSer/pThr/pTyr-binding forkhead associated (FHA) protein
MRPGFMFSQKCRGLLDVNDQTLEHFLAACGSEGPLRLGVGQRHAMESTVQTFSKPFLVIGRAPESDLVLDHWQVSRRHAYLQLIGGRFYCIDLGSRTGTHGGDATRRSGWLEPGRSIQIGPYTIRPEWPPARPKPSGLPPGITWELPGRSIDQATWRMDRYLALIGRSPACMLRMVVPDVSKFHASVVLTHQGLWAIDLLGEHGVFVNGRKVRYALIEDGDEVKVGRHVLRARFDRPFPTLPLSLPHSRSKPGDSDVQNLPEILPALARPELPVRVMMPPGSTGVDLAKMMEQAALGGAIDPSVNLLVHQFGMMQQNMLDQFHNTMMMMFEGFAALHREQAATIREEFEQVRKLSAEIEALRAETARLAKEAASKPTSSVPPRYPGNGHQQAPYPSRPLPKLASDPIKKATMPDPDPEVDIHAQLCLKLANIESERQNRWQKILGMMSKA